MLSKYRILAINPGSTSTKIGVFEDDLNIMEKTIRHEAEELAEFDSIIDQYPFRKQAILETLDQEGINISKLDAVAGRGGLLRAIVGGTYTVNEAMLTDLHKGFNGQHASNLGGIIANEIAEGLNIPAYIVDPVVVDELDPIARVSGMPLIERRSIFHALNQKAVARKVAAARGKEYEELRLIVVHMGGGITVGVHKYGRVVEVNNGLNGEGPFSPERAGTVPTGDLVAMCFSGDYYMHEIMRKIVGQGGLVGYLGTNDAQKVEKMIDAGDEKAKFLYDAMAYQIAREIGSASAVLEGKIDAIVLTGGLSYSQLLIQQITSRIGWIAECVVMPGENELEALSEGTLRVLKGEEEAKIYPNDQMKECDDKWQPNMI